MNEPMAVAVPVILASASRIRSRVLGNSGVEHTCIASSVDEDDIKQSMKKDGADVESVAIVLAEAKAREVAVKLVAGDQPDALVIGADQILECDGRWFDKPPDRKAAAETLRTLRGRTHRLISAVAVFRGEECIWRYLETPVLTMRNFSDKFLENYLETSGSDILESVGAYRLEGSGAQLFSRIDGDYFTILGLPLLALLEFLREADVLSG